jgi:signal transduction histidine kinase
LAIVKEVVQRHGAEITVDDARPRNGPVPPGALVTVRCRACCGPVRRRLREQAESSASASPFRSAAAKMAAAAG